MRTTFLDLCRTKLALLLIKLTVLGAWIFGHGFFGHGLGGMGFRAYPFGHTLLGISFWAYPFGHGVWGMGFGHDLLGAGLLGVAVRRGFLAAGPSSYLTWPMLILERPCKCLCACLYMPVRRRYKGQPRRPDIPTLLAKPTCNVPDAKIREMAHLSRPYLYRSYHRCQWGVESQHEGSCR